MHDQTHTSNTNTSDNLSPPHSEPQSSHQDGNPNMIFPLLMTAVVFFALGAMVTYILTGTSEESGGSTIDVQAAVQGTFTALTPTVTPQPTDAPVAETIADHNPALGPADAPVTLVEFSDYQCPYCARFHEQTLGPLLEHYDGLVRFVYREYPIIGGQASADISAAAQCANLQDKYWEYSDLIWANQTSDQRRTLDSTVLTEYAQDIDLDMEAFNQCLADGTGIELVLVDFQAGRDYGINATPGFFIEGRRFTEGAQPLSRFIEVIDEELSRQGITPPQS